MLRRRLPVILIIVIGVFLGVAIAGVPSSSQSPAVTTFTVVVNGRHLPSADPLIGK